MNYKEIDPCEFQRIRKKLGFKTPTLFAEALGLSHMSIYGYENGTKLVKGPLAMLMHLLDKADEKTLIKVGLK